ncbi:MAG: hypothetical protein ACYCXZ_04730 [Coriobacteriia bacterium]
MVQLTLISTPGPTLGDVVAEAASRWERRSGSCVHCAEAVKATEARFSAWGSRVLSDSERSRIVAYFEAVVRRRLMRATDGRSASVRRRLAAAAIEADLRGAGWTADRAAAEARRTLGEGGAAQRTECAAITALSASANTQMRR